MSVDFSLTPIDTGAAISLAGQFTFTDSHKFREMMDEIGKKKPRAVSLDFGKVDFIDSAGLGMLLLMRDFCQEQSIPIAIHGAQGQVRKIFLISRFDQLFSLQP